MKLNRTTSVQLLGGSCGAVMAILLILTFGAPASLPAQQLTRSAREMQAAVLFDHIPGTISDLPESMLLDVLPADVRLRDVSIRREPYRLSDGLLLLQTPDSQPDVFVRQLIEHPLAERTVVVYPGAASGPAERAARLLAMADLALLNPERPILAVSEHDVLEAFGGPSAADRPASGAGRIWRRLEGGASATAAVAELLRLTAIPSAEIPVAGDPPRSRASSGGAWMESMVVQGDPVLGRLLDGQGLLLVSLIQLEIHREADALGVTNEQIDRLNELQDSLAVVLGQASTGRLVFEPDYAPIGEAAAILRQIDAILGSKTEAMMTNGLAEIRRLFLERLPEAVERAQDRGMHRLAQELDAGTLSFVETTEEGLYDLIRASMEASSFNLIVMGSSGQTQAEIGQVSVQDRYVDSALASDPDWSTARAMSLRLALEDVRLRAAATRLEPDTATVTLAVAENDVVFVGVAHRTGARAPESRLLVMRAASPREMSEQLETIASTGAINELEQRILSGWATFAQATLDL
jgi:hypothetical protein